MELLDIGRKWNTPSYRPIQSSSNVLNGRRARTGRFSASRNGEQVPASWRRSRSCCDRRRGRWLNGTMGFRISSLSLCIQSATIKLHLCGPHAMSPLAPRTTGSTTLMSARHPPHDAIRPVERKPGSLQTPSNGNIRLLDSATPVRTSCQAGTLWEVKMLDVEVLGWLDVLPMP